MNYGLIDEDIASLNAHGVIDNIDGMSAYRSPLYRKRLIIAFRLRINGEVEHYFYGARNRE